MIIIIIVIARREQESKRVVRAHVRIVDQRGGKTLVTRAKN